MDIDKDVSYIVDEEQYKEILTTRKIKSEQWINSDNILVTHSKNISEEICNQFNKNFSDELLKSGLKHEKNEFGTASISTSATITAEATVFMNKIKLHLLSKGANIYYMDTDSIVTDIPLDPDLVGEGLGQFKLEYKIKEGIFISSKTYCLIFEDGSYIVKSKGVYNNSLNPEDFRKLYKGEKVIAVKGNNQKSYGEGFVSIGTKDVLLDGDCFTKRTKIYNEKGEWVDTKPVAISND